MYLRRPVSGWYMQERKGVAMTARDERSEPTGSGGVDRRTFLKYGALTGAALFASLGMGPAYVLIASLYVTSTLLTLRISPVSTKISYTHSLCQLQVRQDQSLQRAAASGELCRHAQ